jgi:hypothetical protein
MYIFHDFLRNVVWEKLLWREMNSAAARRNENWWWQKNQLLCQQRNSLVSQRNIGIIVSNHSQLKRVLNMLQ